MTTEQLSFPQAIQATKSLMDKIEHGQLDEKKIEKEVAAIVNSQSGGRGFFVAYLTSDMSIADNPSVGIINGLRTSTKMVSELLVKNLAMSSAMAVTHFNNNDLDNLKGSQQISRRTSNIIQKIQLDLIEKELEKLQNTISTGKGDYQSFLERWNYDCNQKQAINKAIIDTLI